MYRREPPVDSAAASGISAALPFATVCCIGSVLLLIAGTIVLALIPIYTPQKDLTASSNTNRYLSLSQSGNVPPYGTTTSTACNSINSAMGTAAGVSSGATTASSCNFATQSSGRRRRSWMSSRSRRQSSTTLLFMNIIIDFVKCPRCRIESYINRFVGLQFTTTFEYVGKTYTVTFTVLSIGKNEPTGLSTQATTTSSTSGTTATTTAAATTNASG